jgi:hypothetical protein
MNATKKQGRLKKRIELKIKMNGSEFNFADRVPAHKIYLIAGFSEIFLIDPAKFFKSGNFSEQISGNFYKYRKLIHITFNPLILQM